MIVARAAKKYTAIAAAAILGVVIPLSLKAQQPLVEKPNPPACTYGRYTEEEKVSFIAKSDSIFYAFLGNADALPPKTKVQPQTGQKVAPAEGGGGNGKKATGPEAESGKRPPVLDIDVGALSLGEVRAKKAEVDAAYNASADVNEKKDLQGLWARLDGRETGLSNAQPVAKPDTVATGAGLENVKIVADSAVQVIDTALQSVNDTVLAGYYDDVKNEIDRIYKGSRAPDSLALIDRAISDIMEDANDSLVSRDSLAAVLGKFRGSLARLKEEVEGKYGASSDAYERKGLQARYAEIEKLEAKLEEIQK